MKDAEARVRISVLEVKNDNDRVELTQLKTAVANQATMQYQIDLLMDHLGVRIDQDSYISKVVPLCKECGK